MKTVNTQRSEQRVLYPRKNQQAATRDSRRNYLKSDYPQLYDQVKEKIAAGKWEITGATWVEPDVNLPGGESLVRQFLFANRFVRREFGVKMNVLWLPDVFGYSWALPQIIRDSGIRYFMTTKISWSQFNRFPYDTFYWRGIDGTQVLTYFHDILPGSSIRQVYEDSRADYDHINRIGQAAAAQARQRVINPAVHLDFGKPIRKAAACNLMEEEERLVDFEGHRLTFSINPYQIRTFKIWF